MRITAVCLFCSLAASVLAADELKVAVMDFEDLTQQTEVHSGTPSQLAQKGALLLIEQLAGMEDISLVDRRDFMAKMETSTPTDQIPHLRPSFIHAAQLLQVDAVLRGSLMSISTGTRTVNPTKEGKGIDFETFTVRVMVQALDAIDGTVLAAAQGRESQELRQTDAERVSLGDEQVLAMIEEALSQASKDVMKQLAGKIKARSKRERVSLAVNSTENPAMVEIDGVLVGTTPLQALQVYKGDHLLTVSRPNFTTVTKQLVLDSNVDISVPMFREDLTAEERNAIYKSAEMKVYMTNGKPDLLIQSIQ